MHEALIQLLIKQIKGEKGPKIVLRLKIVKII